MDADWSVELGHDDPALEFPWSSPDGSHRYSDLTQRPGALFEIPEAALYPELGECLLAVNVPSSPWLTVKCDVWLNAELREAEAIYDANLKLCSYVDLIARASSSRFSFERHERWAKSAARELSSDHEEPIACEFIVRRCWYHAEPSARRSQANATSTAEDPTPGFNVTFYLFGYGKDAAQARTRWAEGLRRATPLLTALAA